MEITSVIIKLNNHRHITAAGHTSRLIAWEELGASSLDASLLNPTVLNASFTITQDFMQLSLAPLFRMNAHIETYPEC